MSETIRPWVMGARPRTLPAAVAPILAGTAIAALADSVDVLLVVLCLFVALALQVGVNYANDYSDGVRGTDDQRVGPTRLVASGLASPKTVKIAAFLSFGLAALAGLAMVVLIGQWWLIAVGVACILAGWFYTGGSRPYGYLGLGEIFVFVFFGLVATVGTGYVQTLSAPPHAWLAGASVGALASAILVANNLRDIPTDRESGKRTLAVRLGDRGTRLLFAGLCALAVLGVLGVAALTSWWCALGLIGCALLVAPLRIVLGGANGRALIPVIQATGMAEIGIGLGLLVGALIA
ncbi:MAG: 1,4-dihydroxy-2-naphthoate polyprenyltransferase [Tessaracoccus sp.]